MAAVNESSLCSICNKSSARCYCIGCKKYFCSKDFKEHEQQLSMKFDNEIVSFHDEVLGQIQKLEKDNYMSLDIFNQIEQWKKTTINKVEKAAEKVQHQLIELIDKQRINVVKQIEPITKEILYRREEENFLENDIDRLRKKIDEIQQILKPFIQKDTNKCMIVDNDQIDWNRLIYIRAEQLYSPVLSNANLNTNTKWIQNGITVAGVNGRGTGMHQLCNPWGSYVGDDQTVYIADCSNHRIVEWKHGATTGRVVAGGNGAGNRPDQLNCPTDVIIDKERDSLIICDYENKRVVRWSRQNGKSGETIISNVGCWGLTMDDDRFLYIVDHDKHEVRQYRMEKRQETVVAGGKGPGNRLNQLYQPTYVFVDRDHSVYVSDSNNNRVMKWMKGAKQGIIVAGGQIQGNSLAQLSNPFGISVDLLGTVYVADNGNNRIMRWTQGAIQGTVIVGGNGQGNQSNQLCHPTGLSFDRERNLYVSDEGNDRVQKFNIDRH
ncbi:unnamed protein product [Rotaria sp. Silwood1]|nr:unnamed protein product [Rotaria sp. Silwood1]